MLDEEAINSYLRAGKISAEVKKRVRSFVKEGMSMLELAEKIENEIKELGGSLAFPVNLSIGSIAAHFSPLTDSQDKITKNGILKIDIGVHVNGYIADTAFSIDMDGENEDLVKAAEEAVNRVKESIYPGVKISQISEILEKTIKSYGAVPIRNLTGHGLDRYKLHTGINIPSVTSLMIRGSIPPNSAVAIEPFATKGAGYVTEGDIVGIYSLKSIPSKKLKNLGSDAKTLYEKIYRERGELPFSERWYSSSVGVSNFRRLMRELTLNGISQYYPILVEVTGSQVAQFEESFLLLDKEVIVYTEEK